MFIISKGISVVLCANIRTHMCKYMHINIHIYAHKYAQWPHMQQIIPAKYNIKNFA